VKIINEAFISSGQKIQVSTESQDLVSMKRKTMLGAYASYAASDKLNIGGTMLYMNERPITNKVDLGEEPVSNLMLGLDFQYRDKSQLLTDIVNLLPFYESKTVSSISVEGEVAKLFPGSSKQTGNNVYIDDFEAVETSNSYSLPSGWKLASVPQNQPSLFPENGINNTDNLMSGFNRAKLAWYNIDRTLIITTSSTMPDHIKKDLEMRSNHYMRSVGINEIFPGKQLALNTVNYQNVLDLAFFPKERGPYNYDTEGLDRDGKLKNPEERWGGIMREIESSNFESSNVEYIEFWVLDPFIYNRETNKGGDLYFNLGNISEDVLRDGRLAFENGLPETAEVTDVDTTVWGRVSNQQMLKQVFTSTSETGRKKQDVGLDGLDDADERLFFGKYLENLKGILNEDAYNKVFADPSNDDFHYTKGDDYDKEKLNIIDRYKAFNGFEGNTPINTTSNTIEGSNTNEPDIEDLNSDNTLNESESYYQYKVSIRPNDFEVGKNFIVDKITSKITNRPNGRDTSVTWYQFKVPIKDPESAIGKVDLKSIRFFRMFLTGFSDSIILRFGTLGLVRAEWRKQTEKMTDDGVIATTVPQFDMTSINIEENASKKPINYILPPGIERETDPTNPTPIAMNEQSMLLKVIDLSPGDAKAVYKKVGVDMRQFKKLKMEVHAEAIEGYPLSDNEVSLIVRIGSDYDNYYEYEIPLKLTPVSSSLYVGGDDLYSADRYTVWPDENRLNIDLSIFPALKEKRDAAVRKKGSKWTNSDIFPEYDEGSIDGKNIIRVKGNPSIAEANIIHIGIRNPKDKNSIPKSVEVWVNELRMSGIDEKGGWASTGRVNLQLADLGNISLSGRTESVGWGGINEVSSSRNLEDNYQYNFAANIELGKLLPEKAGVHIPVYYNYSNAISNPEYNPLSSDIKLKDALALLDSPEEKAYLKNISQDVETTESFTLNNISIEPERKNANRKPLPTDIENFSASYSYSKDEAHNVDVAKKLGKTQKASLDYNYSITSNSIEPFKKVKFLDNDFLRIIKDFNFSLLPELVSFRTDMEKDYNQRQARDNSGANIDLPISVQKDFLWNRNFDLRWNLTRNLKFDFTNKNINRIDQMDGIEDRNLYPELYDQIQQELWTQIQNFGRPVNYEHTVDIQYTVPINKLPLLDFTSLRATYQGTYDWSAGAQRDTTLFKDDLGNTVRNGMVANINGQLNLLTLYNKVPYFKKINQKYQSQTRRYGSKNRPDQNKKNTKANQDEKEGKSKEVKFEEKKVVLKANVPKSIFHKLGTEKVKVLVISAKGDTIKGETTIVNENRINFKAGNNVPDASVYITGTLDNYESFAKKALDRTTKFLLGVQNIRATYAVTGGMEMPGFLGEPQAFHFGSQQITSPKGISSLAPGIPFLLGWQDKDFGMKAAGRGWISTDTTILKQFLNQRTETWTFGIQFEPIPNLKFDISGSRREAKNNSSYIQHKGSGDEFKQFSIKESGNFDMTILTIKTAFKEGLGSEQSDLFDKFRGENSRIIQARLNEIRGFKAGVGYSRSPYENDTVQGVSPTSSDVIIPALIATYSGIDASKIPLTARPGLSSIRPNWRVNYSGDPKNISWLKDKVNSLNISHSYKSVYAIGKYETDLNYRVDDNTGLSWVRNQLDENRYFVPQLDITSVTIQEDFSPLINVDVGFENDLSTSFEIRKSRALSFSFSNMQLSELIRNEYTVGIGYRFTGLDMIIKTKRKSETVSNDVNMRLDLSSNDYKTIFRKIGVTGDEKGVLQSGTQLFSIDFQADYMISDKLTIKVYYNYKFQNPHTTESYLQKESKFGLSFNYSIM
jgi:cell surface protein SprA